MEIINKKIPDLDKMHYYITGGKRASVIKHEMFLDNAVDHAKLQKALVRTLEGFPCFALRPVIQNHEIVYEKCTQAPVILSAKEAPDGIAELGTESAHGYIFTITADDCRITACIHHGLADTKGQQAFLKALLFHYYCELGEALDPEEVILDEVACGGYQAYAETHCDDAAKGKGHYDEQDRAQIFQQPGPYYSASEPRQRAFRMTVPMEDVLPLARSMDSTPMPLISVLIGMAYRKTYDVGEKVVLGGAFFDYRQVFGSCANNASGSLPGPYFAKMEKMDFEMQATALRARLDVEKEPENIAQSLKLMKKTIQYFQGMKMPEVTKIHTFTVMALSRPLPNTYANSYIGKVEFPTGVQEHVQAYHMSYPAYNTLNNFYYYEFKGALIINVIQNFASDGLVKTFYSLLKEQFPNAAFEDRGLENYPALDIRKYSNDARGSLKGWILDHVMNASQKKNDKTSEKALLH